MNAVNAVKSGAMNAVNAVKSGAMNAVNIDKWVYGGDAMARVEGRVVFVPFVLPGEVAKVQLKDGDMHARLLEIAAPGDLILIKGSRLARTEDVIEAFAKQSSPESARV